MNMFDYREYKITTNGDWKNPEVKVFLKDTFGRALYETTSLDLAMQWIDRLDIIGRDRNNDPAA